MEDEKEKKDFSFYGKWCAKSILGVSGLIAVELKSKQLKLFTIEDWILFFLGVATVIASVWLALRDDGRSTTQKRDDALYYIATDKAFATTRPSIEVPKIQYDEQDYPEP